VNMRKYQVFIILTMFILMVTGIRLVWVFWNAPEDQPTASQGVMDLRGWDLDRSKPMVLKGQWEFYPNVFLMRDAESWDVQPSFLDVPGPWESSLEYGSYRLRMMLDAESDQVYSIRLPNTATSSE